MSPRTLELWGTLAVLAACGLLGCELKVDRPLPVEPPVMGFPFPGSGFTGGAGSGAGSAACVAGGGPFGFGGAGRFASAPSPHFDLPTLRAEKAPPPISGGTLLTSADGLTLIAADPDRDAVYVVNIEQRVLLRRIELQPGDEPGRLVQDKTGTVHVALRGGKSLASFGLALDAPVTRTPVCDLPRGLAYDGASDRVYVACAEGALVQVDPTAHRAVSKVDLGRDLRDVIVRGEQLFVSRFRSAELMAVNTRDGQVMGVRKPPTTSQQETVQVEKVASSTDGCAVPSFEQRTSNSTPDVAWRTIDVPNRGMMVLHQRAAEAEIKVTPGGYGGGMNCAPGIVHGAVTLFGNQTTSVDVAVPGLLVDIAVDPTAALVAIANPAGWGTGNAVLVMEMPGPEFAAQQDLSSGAACMSPSIQVSTDGQPTAVSFVSPYLLAIQEREPAGITFFDVRPGGSVAQRLDLKQPSRYDTGHTLFHVATGSGLACASCHAEAGDDSHTWTFDSIGARRTQNLRGGILGSEPFHWNGDMRDFSMLVDEVFVGRMLAPTPRVDQADALAHWIDRQPLLHAEPEKPDAVARGQALFVSEAVGCGSCHNGARLSNNESADVGTGAFLQVPSLRNVSFRAPLMHNGCATTTNERFAACGGGDKHGRTSHLKPEQLSDLVAYLDSL